MALNFSHRPIFGGGLSEENLVSPIRMRNGYRVEGIQEKGGVDGFGKGWHDVENCFDYGGDRCDSAATQDSVSKDILDLLPSDPFGMDISTTFTAITGWLEDLEVDYGGYRSDELGANGENYQLFAGLNFIWNNAMRFHTFPGSKGNVCGEEKKLHWTSEFGGFGECSQKEVGAASCNFNFGSCNSGFGSACNVDDVLDYNLHYKDVAIASVSGDTNMDDLNPLGGDELAPHPALSFSLSYLGLSDLLVVERVCKSLHSTVRGDPLLWRSIHIDQPLNEKITDDALLQLTNRAQGNLQCLSLVECTRITDDGLKRVLEVNPKLIKLSVPGCTRLSIEGIVGILKAYNSMGSQGVKHLHIGGLYGVTQKHYEELKLLLGPDSQLLQHSPKPHFYCRGNLYLSLDDDRAIDIEVCPRCQNLRLVYDCPAEGCQGVGHPAQVCRACTLCIPRCSQCGHCINDSEYEETFCLELLCSSCSKQLVKCLERTDRKVGPAKSVVLHEES
ncbi:F-box protein SKIP14 [Gastrolobium bilobum]|uniref:F-box protein SKIP14 n=1 Tax=Gastrolobium bilobum TaxID=150636 RepID=UPI002AAF3B62|nr:F-box protein SKIP14 [Gastrolobium bilobum]